MKELVPSHELLVILAGLKALGLTDEADRLEIVVDSVRLNEVELLMYRGTMTAETAGRLVDEICAKRRDAHLTHINNGGRFN